MAVEEIQKIQTVGRRKTSVARVLLRPGKGEWTINGRSMAEYFPRRTHQMRVEEPMQVTELDGRFDVQVRVNGGGLTGQADAIRMGLSRALVAYDEAAEIVEDKSYARGNFLDGAALAAQELGFTITDDSGRSLGRGRAHLGYHRQGARLS